MDAGRRAVPATGPGGPLRRAPGAAARPRARAQAGRGLEQADLLAVRAALAAGASPAAAVAAAPGDGALSAAATQLALGASLADVAAQDRGASVNDPGARALVRALAVVELAGSGGLQAVDRAARALRDEAELARLLRVRTAQARGTALVLGLLPLAAWLLLVATDPAALRFYGTTAGGLTGAAAVILALAGRAWSRRIVARARDAAAAADPLTPPLPPWDRRRAAAAAGPVLVLLVAVTGPVLAILAAAGAGAVAGRGGRPSNAAGGGSDVTPGARRRRLPAGQAGPARRWSGGAAEAVDLLAVALAAGLATPAAVALVASLAPPAAGPALRAAARRLQAGWPAIQAFDDGPLAPTGRVLGAAERWGAPAAPGLHALADDLRADRRAATELAAEQVQLLLIFPTTVLTLPAFVLAVLPPLVWAAFAR